MKPLFTQSMAGKTTWNTETLKGIKKLCKRKEAAFFVDPVDPVAHGATHYELVIETPMDFDTIQTKLQNDEYKAMSECIEDAELVFTNAKMYNPSDHAVHIEAIACQKIFCTYLTPTILKYADKETKQRWDYLDKPGGFKWGLQVEQNQKQNNTKTN
eukprot:260782_1